MDNYKELKRVLDRALGQASRGKGKVRHAVDEPFENQKICVLNRWLAASPVAGALFQAAKKIIESSRLDEKAAIRELRGAINYVAAAIILLEERSDSTKEYEQVFFTSGAANGAENHGFFTSGDEAKDHYAVSQGDICSMCANEQVKRNEMPCKKCYNLPFKPHFVGASQL